MDFLIDDNFKSMFIFYIMTLISSLSVINCFMHVMNLKLVQLQIYTHFLSDKWKTMFAIQSKHSKFPLGLYHLFNIIDNFLKTNNNIKHMEQMRKCT